MPIGQVSAGGDHTCAVVSGEWRTVRCFGGNTFGQLGYGNSGAGTDHTLPTRDVYFGDWKDSPAQASNESNQQITNKLLGDSYKSL